MSVGLTDIIQSLNAGCIKVGSMKSKSDLQEKLSAVKNLVAQDRSTDENVVPLVKFNWEPLSIRWPDKVAVDLGIPNSYEELVEWAVAKKFEKKLETHTAAAYLEYITSGQYQIETKDWGNYETNRETTEKGPDGDLIPKAPWVSSKFFHKKYASASKAPYEMWRYTTSSSRKLLCTYLGDDSIKYDFQLGFIKDWEDLETIMLKLMDIEDHKGEFIKLKTLRKNFQGLLKSKENPRMIFQNFQAILTPFLCFEGDKIKKPSLGRPRGRF